jgi:hypothetical protein
MILGARSSSTPKKDNTLHKSTIKENLSYLLNHFSMNDIRFAVVATISKLDLVASTEIDELASRKSKLIEFFSQLIYNNMSILGNSMKSAERYVLKLLINCIFIMSIYS